MFLFCACSAANSEEKMVLEGLEQIKDNLLDPDSVIVYKCYLWPCHSWDSLKENPDTEEYDETAVYYYIGATNRAGGITDEAYVAVFDKSGKYIAHDSKTNYDKWVNDSDSVYIDPDVHGEFLNATFWDAFGWPDYAIDYTSFLKEKVKK